MTDLITTQKADMTREEAQHALAQLRGTEERQKELLLEMHERNAHRAMGHTNWDDFCKGSFGFSYDRFKQLIRAGRTERIIGNFLPISSTSSSTSSISKFNEEMLLELAKLKDPQKIICAAKEALEAASTMTYRGKESRFNKQLRLPLVKGIVNRILAEPQKPLVLTPEQNADAERYIAERGPVQPADPAPYVAPPLIPTPTLSAPAPKTRFDEAVDTQDTRPIINTPAPVVPVVTPSAPPAPAQKYTRGVEHKYLTCRWDEDDEVLRVVFALPDGTEGAVVVPGGFLP